MIRIKLKNLIKISKIREKDESSNSIGHEDYHPILLVKGIFLTFHWA